MSGCTELRQLDTVPSEPFCAPRSCPLCWSCPKPALGKISQLKLKHLNAVGLTHEVWSASEVWVLHPDVLNIPRTGSKWLHQGVFFSVRGCEFSAAAFLHFWLFSTFSTFCFFYHWAAYSEWEQLWGMQFPCGSSESQNSERLKAEQSVVSSAFIFLCWNYFFQRLYDYIL